MPSILLADTVKIYADVFFIVNLSMDLLVFLALSFAVGAKKVPVRFFLSALLTSVFQISQLLFPGNGNFSFIIWLLVAFTACSVAYKGLSLMRLAVSWALFISLSSLLSAAFTALFTHFGKASFLPETGSTSGGIVPITICTISLILSFLLSVALKKVKNKIKRKKKKGRSTLKISSCGEEIEMSAYRDSGNLLREPIGGLPVIITGKEKMLEIVPKTLHGVFFSYKMSEKTEDPSLSDAKRVRIIPITPIGSGGARILFGYVPDKITVDGKEANACIALDASSSDFGGCDALLPNALM